MSLLTRLFEKLYKLPPAQTRDISIERDIPIPMTDGVILLADRIFPNPGDTPTSPSHPPTLLVRSPYGRANLFGVMFGELFAERGFQVLVQSCRGTFGSGGAFEPFHHERADGLATLAWLKQQPWFSGKLGMLGPSYLGIVQWAIAAPAGSDIGALAISVSGSYKRGLIYPGETFALETALAWQHIVDRQDGPLLDVLLHITGVDAAVRGVNMSLPLNSLDRRLLGKSNAFYHDWLEHSTPDDPFWKALDFSASMDQIQAPIHLVGGYYDVFLPRQLEDFKMLEEAGKRPYLTLGPWHHTHPDLSPAMLRESLSFLRAHLLGDKSGLRTQPVKLYVSGAEEWREYSTWPPPGARSTPYYLHPGGYLSPEQPPESPPDRYRYDPHDPTPSVGGPSLNQDNAGIKDMGALEERSDLLVYSTGALEEEVEVIGPVWAELYVRSTRVHTDFLVRVCDVSPKGKSVNLCEGIVRLGLEGREADAKEAPIQKTQKVRIEAWATGHRFKRGHRIRVHVASGAHPCFARNLGSGEPLATGVTLCVADQEVFHDPARPSAVMLPVMGAEGKER